jgi:hypothetical protein
MVGHIWATPKAAVSAEYNFYRDLLGPIATDPHAETTVVLSNPRLMLYFGDNKQRTARAGTDEFAVPPSLQTLFSRATNDLQSHYQYRFLLITERDYTGMGEAVSALRLGQLFQSIGRPVRITQSRFLNWGTGQKEHLVLLGGPNILGDFVRQNLVHSNFSMVEGGIKNEQPLAGEQALYPTAPDQSRTYGLVWMVQSPSGSRVLLMTGRTSTGPAGVGSFVCDPEKMRPVYEKLKSSANRGTLPPNWQVVLKIESRDDVPVDVSYVTHRLNRQP